MQRKRRQCKTAELLLLLLTAAVLLSAPVSLSLSRFSRLASVHTFARLRRAFYYAAPPRLPTSFVSFTHLPSFLTSVLFPERNTTDMVLETQPGWARRYASRPKPRATRFGYCSNLASGDTDILRLGSSTIG